MKIYVATHKIENLEFKSKIYELILVGSYNKTSHEMLRDDSGENISNKNENYCELTGLYWIWKNSTEDIVGLAHYRRFLSKKCISINSKYYLNENDLKKEFINNKVDIILPKPVYYKGTAEDSFTIAPTKEDMRIVKDVIAKMYPEYIDSYNKFVNSKQAYLYNMLITRKEIFDKYCEWLFNILFEVERVMDKDTYIHDSYRKRMFGFLSERLLNIWVIYNKDNLNIKECYVVNKQIKVLKRIRIMITQTIRKINAKIKMK